MADVAPTILCLINDLRQIWCRGRAMHLTDQLHCSAFCLLRVIHMSLFALLDDIAPFRNVHLQTQCQPAEPLIWHQGPDKPLAATTMQEHSQL